MNKILCLSFLLAFGAAACAESEQQKTAPQTSTADDAGPGPADAGTDAGADAGAGTDAGAEPVVTPDDVTFASPVDDPGLGIDKKFALAVYHFNIQYVAGGGEEVEDAIVQVALEPVLDVYLRHPSWGANFEMQGYMIDVMAERHPAVLEKLRQMVESRQIELTTFHYSDQFFLAFEKTSLLRSLTLNDETLFRNGLHRSRAVFTQEGQFGVGQLPIAHDFGYQPVMLPKNLFSYQFGEEPGALYEQDGVYVLPAPHNFSDPNTGLSAIWTFLGDGETVATNGIPPSIIGPLVLPGFEISEEALARFEAELTDIENQGYRLIGVENYLRHLAALGVAAQPLPPVLDGDWQPRDTDNVFRWMGRTVASWERDNLVRTLNVQSHQELQAAETLAGAAAARGLDVARAREKIKDGWRRQIFAEVTDATGWSPGPLEVQYGLDESAAALALAQEAIAELKTALALQFVKIDTRAESIEALAALPEAEDFPEVEPPVTATVVVSSAWSYETKYRKIAAGQTAVEITFRPGPEAKAGQDAVQAQFPRRFERAVVSPALTLGQVQDQPLATYTFENGYFHHALPNGLIALDERLFLIKDTRWVHLAGRISVLDQMIVFEDQTIDPREQQWRFVLVEGDATAALRVAEDLNVLPTLVR